MNIIKKIKPNSKKEIFKKQDYQSKDMVIGMNEENLKFK